MVLIVDMNGKGSYLKNLVLSFVGMEWVLLYFPTDFDEQQKIIKIGIFH